MQTTKTKTTGMPAPAVKRRGVFYMPESYRPDNNKKITKVIRKEVGYEII